MNRHRRLTGQATVLLLAGACAVSGQPYESAASLRGRLEPAGWSLTMPAPPSEALRARLQRIAICCTDDEPVVLTAAGAVPGGAVAGAIEGGFAGATGLGSGWGSPRGDLAGCLVGFGLGSIFGGIYGAVRRDAARDAWKKVAPSAQVIAQVLAGTDRRLALRGRVIRLAEPRSQRYIQRREEGADAVLRLRLVSLGVVGDWQSEMSVSVTVSCRLEDPQGELLYGCGCSYVSPPASLRRLGKDRASMVRAELQRGIDRVAEAIVDHLFLVYEPGRGEEEA